MRKTVIVAAVALATVVACVPPKPPVIPKPQTPKVSVDIQLYCNGTRPAIDREVYLDNDAGNQSNRSNGDGWIRFVVPATLRSVVQKVLREARA